jgi:D-glycerate 3-kinase
MPEDQWDIIEQAQDIIIFEGWCLGAEPQDPTQLLPPTNELEFNEDKQGIWRNYINEQLQGKYRELFSMIDIWAMLTVSDFNTVFVWRLE